MTAKAVEKMQQKGHPSKTLALQRTLSRRRRSQQILRPGLTAQRVER